MSNKARRILRQKKKCGPAYITVINSLYWSGSKQNYHYEIKILQLNASYMSI